MVLPGIQALFGFQPIAGFKSAISTNSREPNSLYIVLDIMFADPGDARDHAPRGDGKWTPANIESGRPGVSRAFPHGCAALKRRLAGPMLRAFSGEPGGARQQLDETGPVPVSRSPNHRRSPRSLG
jgi:hypothetical protein